MRTLARGIAAGAISLVLVGQAGATLVRDPKLATAPNPNVEEGGHRLLPTGRKHVSCSQYGSPVLGMNNVTQLAMPAWGLWGAMSFLRAGDHGRTMVVPMADGSMTCIVTPDR